MGLYLLTTLSQLLTTLKKKPFENIVVKEENACNQPFLLFPQCFLTLTKANQSILLSFILLPVNALNLIGTTILSFGKASVTIRQRLQRPYCVLKA